MHQTPWVALRDSGAHVLLTLTSTPFINKKYINTRSTLRRNARRFWALLSRRRANPLVSTGCPAHISLMSGYGRETRLLPWPFKRNCKSLLSCWKINATPHKLRRQRVGTPGTCHKSGDLVDVVRRCTPKRLALGLAHSARPRKSVSVLTRLLPPWLRYGILIF